MVVQGEAVDDAGKKVEAKQHEAKRIAQLAAAREKQDATMQQIKRLHATMDDVYTAEEAAQAPTTTPPHTPTTPRSRARAPRRGNKEAPAMHINHA